MNKGVAKHEDASQHMLSEEIHVYIRQERNMEFTTKSWNNNPENAGTFWISQISCSVCQHSTLCDVTWASIKSNVRYMKTCFVHCWLPEMQPRSVEWTNEEIEIPMGIMYAWETFNIHADIDPGQSEFQGSPPDIRIEKENVSLSLCEVWTVNIKGSNNLTCWLNTSTNIRNT